MKLVFSNPISYNLQTEKETKELKCAGSGEVVGENLTVSAVISVLSFRFH